MRSNRLLPVELRALGVLAKLACVKRDSAYAAGCRVVALLESLLGSRMVLCPRAVDRFDRRRRSASGLPGVAARHSNPNVLRSGREGGLAS